MAHPSMQSIFSTSAVRRLCHLSHSSVQGCCAQLTLPGSAAQCSAARRRVAHLRHNATTGVSRQGKGQRDHQQTHLAAPRAGRASVVCLIVDSAHSLQSHSGARCGVRLCSIQIESKAPTLLGCKMHVMNRNMEVLY